MKAKKLLSILLALFVVLAVPPIAAGVAGDPFCTVGATAYDDLAAAAEEASSSGKPILITKDFDCAGQLELDGITVAIELQGFTLNVTQASGTGAAGAGLSVRNGGALTVNGPGTLNFKGPFAGINVGSAAAGDYGTVSITGGAAVTATGSNGVVSNNNLNEVQVSGALGGFAADTYCVYCVDGKVEVFGSITSPLDAPPVRNGIYASNTAEVHVYGSVVGFDANITCAAAAAANVWILGFGGSQHMVTDGAGFDIKIGGARAEGYSTSFTYPGYTERFRIQKYSGANAAGMDPGYPLGYIFESRVWVKIPDAIAPEPITGVTSPVAGAAPSMAIDDGTHFTAALGWSPPPLPLNSGTLYFDSNTVYTARIHLTANPGYIFSGMNSDAQIMSFTVNGITPELENNANYSDRLVFSITFPATGEFPLITPEPLTGVIPPVVGAVPCETIDDGTNFTAAFGWFPNPPRFDANTVYTARIDLTANPGYGFSGLNTDALIEGFTVNSIKPTFVSINDKSNKLAFWVDFPATGDFPVITSGPITGVIPPAVGASPSNAINDGANYTAQLRSWSPSAPTFDANTVYTARIELAANYGYGFSGLNTDALIEGFTVNGIKPTFESISDRSDRLVLSITFPATGHFPTVTPGPITGVTSPRPEAFASWTIHNGMNYTAAILSWSPYPNKYEVGTVYTATIRLTANPGYSFSGLDTDAAIAGFTVNGVKPEFVSLNDRADELVFSITFPLSKGVFGTRHQYYKWYHYILFFLFFGFIWMW